MFPTLTKKFSKKNNDFKEKAIKKLRQNVNVAFEKRANVNKKLKSDDYITPISISFTVE